MNYQDFTWRTLLLHTEQKLEDYFGPASEPYRFVLLELFRELAALDKHGEYPLPMEPLVQFFIERREQPRQIEAAQPAPPLSTEEVFADLITGLMRPREWKFRERFEAQQQADVSAVAAVEEDV